METDPVCGMNVDPRTAEGSVDWQGKTYYFCSAHCRQQFERSPEKYMKQ